MQRCQVSRPGRHTAKNEGTGMRRSLPAAEIFAEKEFYLDEFHERSLIFALRAADWIAEPERPAVVEVLTTLLRNDTHMVLLLEMGRGTVEQRRVTALAHHLARGGHTLRAEPVDLVREEESVEQRCLQYPNVTLLTRAMVVKLNTNPTGKAVTEVVVERHGARETYQGGIVVVSAGAANSAKL